MEKLTYQTKINRLEEITVALEQGDLALEESLASFEEGIALLKACEKELDAASHQVMILTESDEEKPFMEEMNSNE